MYWLSFAIVIGCLVVSAFFSASETALTGASRASMMRLQKQGSREAGIVGSLLNAREHMIGALLLGNNIANIGASALATGIFTAWFGEVGVLYATGAMTVLVVIFAEVLPKTVAINAPERVALLVARPMKFLVMLLGPVLTVIEAVVRGMMRLFGIPIGVNQPILSPTERLRGAVDLIHHEGGVEKQDRDMLGGLLDLRELQVSDVMVHRTEMVLINADLPSEDLVREVLATEYTRIPLWREKPENIVGVLHAKDLLRAIRAADGDLSKVDVNAIAAPPWFVPEMRPLPEQLKAFRRRKTHFALVVDEYGEVEGLVTLEDILEEIVGDISDEHDVVVAGVRAQPDGSVLVDGSVPIRDLNRAMDWNLPDEEATTIAGLVIHEARSIPERGQSFTFHGFRFRVLRRERNRITALRIVPLTGEAEMPVAPRRRRAGSSF
ncbi:HlyC/CorC family transporter [Bradyrhizobium sp. U87765 SZCCT0131]|uniref:HlyC/CorC family transporter n=1 Tax=unclassified Bradyrhizobium TaxID=2631580 RepID=UPI001BAB675A|nr:MULTISPECIES: HlyC/CorC family transporter [unclassified Bradyrhizobium]MBR1217133.1 HlyC/CorC family transporter [Bradyrhizobium sp. U87765 SZCCT0131]MBR1259111.1 HlyC/CorC family transporter [Bradyrhizobium sp. U87765 SZCCT0134]MBR1305252.1 HlyC/CorC family transporter [Bradyrhizobium sp. U87765 SZCCT0110]MBR1321038.1 HlyC/CorC family transporter [Bradyrhizobium sp. U87765 SZCCT0109]MBR1350308.1 HlyC/CorC family transporter [Bradyrhizobium sp. U87765 SZCCT0048]